MKDGYGVVQTAWPLKEGYWWVSIVFGADHEANTVMRDLYERDTYGIRTR